MPSSYLMYYKIKHKLYTYVCIYLLCVCLESESALFAKCAQTHKEFVVVFKEALGTYTHAYLSSGVVQFFVVSILWFFFSPSPFSSTVIFPSPPIPPHKHNSLFCTVCIYVTYSILKDCLCVHVAQWCLLRGEQDVRRADPSARLY